MESEVERPSIWDIRNGLLSCIDHAEEYALRHPEHAEAVTRLVQELRRIKKELMSSFKPNVRPAPRQDLLYGLTNMRVFAEFMRERDPENSDALTRVVDDLIHAQAEFLGKVRPLAETIQDQ